MKRTKAILFLFFVCLFTDIVAGEETEEDSLETGYLYERPNKSLLIPTDEVTGQPATEKDDFLGSTEIATTGEPEEQSTTKPEPKTPDGYLPPEEEQFTVNENSEVPAGDENGSKGRKRNIQLVKGKFASVKEKEKARVRQILGLMPKQNPNRVGTLKETKQIFRN